MEIRISGAPPGTKTFRAVGAILKAFFVMPAAASASTPSADPLGDFLTRQLTQVELLHVGFVDAYSSNPVAALVMLGVLLLALSLACRYFIYLTVRVSGQSAYNNAARVTENVYLMAAAAFGALCGEVCFQNLWLAACVAVGFSIISVGAVIEGLAANEKSKERKRGGYSGGSRSFHSS